MFDFFISFVFYFLLLCLVCVYIFFYVALLHGNKIQYISFTLD